MAASGEARPADKDLARALYFETMRGRSVTNLRGSGVRAPVDTW